MSRGLRTVLGVVASVAIPFAAPAIAGMGFMGGIAGAIGSTATSTLVGAGLGAANAALTGGDVAQGALFGGIGGGVGGYAQAGNAARTGIEAAGGAYNGSKAALAASSAPTVNGVGVTSLGSAGLQGKAGLSSAVTGATTGASNAAGGFSNITAGAGNAVRAGSKFVDNTAASLTGGRQAGVDQFTGTAEQKAVAAPNAGRPAGIGGRTREFLGSEDFLRSAIPAIVQGATNTGASEAELAMLAAREREFQNAQANNLANFELRTREATDLIDDADEIDPEYFGRLSANRAKMAGERARREGTRGMVGDRLRGENRRYALGTQRNAASAYDSGQTAGLQQHLNTRIAGINAIPSGYNMTQGGPGIAAQYNDLHNRRRDRQADNQYLAGIFTDNLFNDPRRRRSGADSGG